MSAEKHYHQFGRRNNELIFRKPRGHMSLHSRKTIEKVINSGWHLLTNWLWMTYQLCREPWPSCLVLISLNWNGALQSCWCDCLKQREELQPEYGFIAGPAGRPGRLSHPATSLVRRGGHRAQPIVDPATQADNIQLRLKAQLPHATSTFPKSMHYNTDRKKLPKSVDSTRKGAEVQPMDWAVDERNVRNF